MYGYQDNNFDGENTSNEKFIRKATIELKNNEINLIVEDVPSVDNNYKIIDTLTGEHNFSGAYYLSAGTYTFSSKVITLFALPRESFKEI